MFKVYHRTFWKENLSWPEGREPRIGKSYFVDEVETEKEARELCAAWNRTHEAGKLSDKAEYEEI
jgi:hypothetical protein